MKTTVISFLLVFLISIVHVGDAKDMTNSISNNYVGYYNNLYSVGDYKIVDNCIFYKSNIAEIKSVIFKIGDYILKGDDLNIRGNSYLSTNIIINGFTPTQGKYYYTYSACATFENGEVFEKNENIEDFSFSNPCDLGFYYNTPSMKNGAAPKIMYINFCFKDRFSNAIIQGFYKFRLLP